MKRILFSLGIILVAYFAYLQTVRVVSHKDNGSTSVSVPSRLGNGGSTGSEPVDGTVVRFSWRSIESPDYAEFISRLRAIDCPEQRIQDIILAEIDRVYAAKEAPIKARVLNRPYWESKDLKSIQLSAGVRHDLMELRVQKKDLVHSLLGIEIDINFDQMLSFGGEVDAAILSLSPSKRSKVVAILESFNSQADPFRQRVYPTPDDLKAIAELEKSKDTSLRLVLSEAEMTDFDVKTSRVAQEMRSSLRGFSPSESEFLELFKLRKAFEERNGSYGMREPTDRAGIAAYQTAEKEYKGQVQQLLGSERFTEFERVRDFAYMSLLSLTEGTQIPTSTVNEVYDMRKAYWEATAKVSKMEMSEEDRKLTLQQIRSANEDRLASLLGEKILNRYRMSGGSWLNR